MRTYDVTKLSPNGLTYFWTKFPFLWFSGAPQESLKLFCFQIFEKLAVTYTSMVSLIRRIEKNVDFEQVNVSRYAL